MSQLRKIRVAQSDFWENLGIDCIWICLEKNQKELALHSFVQHLDWKLGGKVTRHLLSSDQGATFLATGDRISVPFLAIDFMKPGVSERFCRNAMSMKFSRVLVITENSDLSSLIEEELRQSSCSIGEWMLVCEEKPKL